MLVKSDLHNHLRAKCIKDENYFNSTIDLASLRLGPFGIFAVVNFSDQRYEDYISQTGYEREYLGPSKNGLFIKERLIYLVKGEEVNTNQGHVLFLGLGVNEHIKHNRSLEDTLKEAKDFNPLVISIGDHPKIKGIGNYLLEHKELISSFDAVEIHNGELNLTRNIDKKVIELYKELRRYNPNLGALSTSDGHSDYELASSWTELEFLTELSADLFLESLGDAIRRTDLSTPRLNKKSYLGVMEHISRMVYNRLLSKISSKEHPF